LQSRSRARPGRLGILDHLSVGLVGQASVQGAHGFYPNRTGEDDRATSGF